MIKLVLDFYPPTVNTYWGHRVIKGKKSFVSTYVTAKGKKFKENVKEVVDSQAPLGRITDRAEMIVVLNPPDRRKRDIDNNMKGTLDALKDVGLLEDDELIDTLIIRREDVIKGGRTTILLREIPTKKTWWSFIYTKIKEIL